MTCVVFAHDVSDSGALLRFTVFGRDLSEWRVLAAWAKRYQLPNESLRWAVQMPRIYQVATEFAFRICLSLPSSRHRPMQLQRLLTVSIRVSAPGVEEPGNGGLLRGHVEQLFPAAL